VLAGLFAGVAAQDAIDQSPTVGRQVHRRSVR
jgi:hypothetical protein